MSTEETMATMRSATEADRELEIEVDGVWISFLAIPEVEAVGCSLAPTQPAPDTTATTLPAGHAPELGWSYEAYAAWATRATMGAPW